MVESLKVTVNGTQPTIYAAKSLIEYYVSINKLSIYLDIHAASKKSKNYSYFSYIDELKHNCFLPLMSFT